MDGQCRSYLGEIDGFPTLAEADRCVRQFLCLKSHVFLAKWFGSGAIPCGAVPLVMLRDRFEFRDVWMLKLVFGVALRIPCLQPAH